MININYLKWLFFLPYQCLDFYFFKKPKHTVLDFGLQIDFDEFSGQKFIYTTFKIIFYRFSICVKYHDDFWHEKLT